jgi:hypothetical protein
MSNHNTNYSDLVPEKIYRFCREDSREQIPAEIYSSLGNFEGLQGHAGYLRHNDLVSVIEKPYNLYGSRSPLVLRIIVVGSGIVGYAHYLHGFWEEVRSE